jgi:hypothetical protein
VLCFILEFFFFFFFRCLCFIMAAKRYLVFCHDMNDGDGGGVHTFPVCLLVSGVWSPG